MRKKPGYVRCRWKREKFQIKWDLFKRSWILEGSLELQTWNSWLVSVQDPQTVAKFLSRKWSTYRDTAEYLERFLGNDIRTKNTVLAVRYSQGLQEKIPPSPSVSHYLRYILLFNYLVFTSLFFFFGSRSAPLCAHSWKVLNAVVPPTPVFP